MDSELTSQVAYEHAQEWYVDAYKELTTAKHLLELAEINFRQAEDNLARHESAPGEPLYKVIGL